MKTGFTRLAVLLLIAAAAAQANVGFWLGPALGVATTTGHMGYTLGSHYRFGGHLGVAAGFDRWNHVVRFRLGTITGGQTPPLPEEGVAYTYESGGVNEAAGDVSWEYRLRGDLAGGRLRLMPGFATSWFWGQLNYGRDIIWAGPAGLAGRELLDTADTVNDWTFTPTFGVEHSFSVLTWSARAGVGLRSHFHRGRFSWTYVDYEHGWTPGETAEGRSAGIAGAVARADATARVAFGRHYGVEVAATFRTDVFDFGDCAEAEANARTFNTTADLNRTDFLVIITPAFSF